MNRWTRILIAGSATLLIAACGENRSSPVGPELEARRSGGVIIGGNNTRSDSTTTVQSTDGGQLQSDGTPEETSDGGVIIGGN